MCGKYCKCLDCNNCTKFRKAKQEKSGQKGKAKRKVWMMIGDESQFVLILNNSYKNQLSSMIIINAFWKYLTPIINFFISNTPFDSDSIANSIIWSPLELFAFYWLLMNGFIKFLELTV